MTQEHTSTLSVAMRTMDPPLAAALIDAQGRIGWVGKDGYNKHQQYNYATAEGIIADSRVALNAAGLGLFHEWTAERYAALPESGGKGTVKLAIGRIIVRYCVFHTSGSALCFETSTPIVPEVGRPEDKAEQASLTANLAYSLRGLLLIPRGEAPEDAREGEEDIDGRDDREPDPAQTRPPPRRLPTPVSVDDVPFQVSNNDAAHVSRSSAPERVPNPDADIVKAILAPIGTAATCAIVRAYIADSESLPMSDESRAVVNLAAAHRMIGVAASPQELAEVGEFMRALMNAGTGDKDWHVGAGRAYKARRAELNGAATGTQPGTQPGKA